MVTPHRLSDVIRRLAGLAPEYPHKLIVYGEIGTDSDEIEALMILTTLIRLGFVELLAVIGNHKPALYHARQGRRTLDDLGFPDVPVGRGEEIEGASTTVTEKHSRHLAHMSRVVDGQTLLRDTLRSLPEGEKVTLVANSGFTDIAWLLLAELPLFQEKVEKVVIMGGVVVENDVPKLDEDGYLMPNVRRGVGPANNLFDPGSALMLYRTLQDMGIPIITTTRDAGDSCKIPFTVFDELEESGHVVGGNLAEVQREAINDRWKMSVDDTLGQGKGDVVRNIDWFFKVFCKGQRPDGTLEEILAIKDIFPHIVAVGGEFISYDGLNVLAAVPEISMRLFSPYAVEVKGMRHQIIGVSTKANGVRNGQAVRDMLMACMLDAVHYQAPAVRAFQYA
jgi:hypothetical protein